MNLFWGGVRKGYILAHQLALLAVLACSGCQRPVVYVPEPPQAPVVPPVQPPPPVDPPPPPPPQNPPSTVAEILGRIELGMSLEAVVAVFGRPPEVIPGTGSFGVYNWYVREGEKQFVVFVVTSAGRVTRKGSSEVEEVR